MPNPLRYTICPKNPGAHLFEVTLDVCDPDPLGQVFSLPAWIPGSYVIRDFARHVVAIRAESDGAEIGLTKIDKSSWQADATEGPIRVVAEIYGYDQSVRGANLDTTHAYFNGPCVFLAVSGHADRPCELLIEPPPDGTGADWRVATSMRPKDAGKYGFGTYEVPDYAELIDHPVEIGNLLIGEFEACGIPHVIAIRGKAQFDMARICKDLAALCTYQLGFLGRPQNLDRYVFLLTVLDNGYGGLEHRWSSSLACARRELPRRGEAGVSDGYRRFLGLCSHEYFHLWNVKRMMPARFSPYDLSTETYTGLLWVFEGITSYYDDLLLLRAGLISEDSYLELLGRTVTRHLRARGRFRQSVEESSFDVWTRFYKQDANSSNAIVSYYVKGSLIGLALDLTLRHRSGGSGTLDDVMRECWAKYGETGDAMPERGLESIATKLSGTDLEDFFEHYVRGTGDLPLQPLLIEFGVTLNQRPATGAKDTGGKAALPEETPKSWLGANLAAGVGRSVVSLVHAGSPAEQAGMAPGDEAVALDELRLTAANFDDRLRSHHAGDKAVVSVFRDDELLRLAVQLGEPPEDTAYLEMMDGVSDPTRRIREAWLHGK